MSLVHVHRYQNSGRLASTLIPLASLKVLMYALSFLLSSEKINTTEIGLSDPHGIPSVSIHGSPIHSNISQYIAYKINY